MSTLYIYTDNQPEAPQRIVNAHEDIASLLCSKGVRFEQWPTRDLPEGADQEAILAAYADDVQRLKDECGFTTADVVSLTPDHPQKDAFRQKFLSEHRHVEDEVRFFVDGNGLFYLHLDNEVWVVNCTRGDLISVPDGTRHWFDMGPAPRFTCIRLFSNPEGWVADFTGDDIADKFPRYEALLG
ncbi:cupin [Hahella sp. SMD15-11]|uniref:Acireductone dioxygenase n=1 Tax=Thermohahella caldifontis TaxID=3142973 RepID=A0AB39UW87_9GAMM